MLSSTTDKQRQANHIFISYSHKDKKWLDEFLTHLSPYIRQGTISAWSDAEIKTGTYWRQEIENKLSYARIAVLLVTPNFLASEFIMNDELPKIFNAAKEQGLVIYWIPIRASSYETTFLKEVASRPTPNEPIAETRPAKRDKVWVDICKELFSVSLLPEDQAIRAATANPIEFYSCFISYAHADKDFARQLHDFLQGHGIRCWLDEHQLKPGHNIFDEIDRGIKLWDKVLLCASESSLNSWWVDNEIERAFKKEETTWRNRNKKVLAIIPLDLDGYIFDGWKSSKAVDIKSRLAVDFKGWQTDNAKLHRQFELVLSALQVDEDRE